MASNLKKALEIIATTSDSDVAKGNAFEKLTKIFLENDPLQNQLYSQVWTYEDWAKERPGYSPTDIGIDLVAKIRDEDGFCAIQCKFYGEKNAITKADLDSFISASSSSDFTRLLLVDTSLVELGTHAESVIDNLDKEFLRLPFSDLDESRIDWLSYVQHGDVRLDRKKDPMDHQNEALQKAEEGLAQADRGKIIMACGTGKTYTSLMIAEKLAGEGKLVLYMVPSLALMSQTVRSWKNDCKKDFTAFSACSDQKVGQIDSKSDQIQLKLSDLAFPATTKSDQIADNVAKADKSKMTVIFSTYQSLEVISRAQHQYGLPEFDLILCDEAHRTTGATLVDTDESNFVKIHDNQHVAGKKRLYMTATPRVYGEQAKSKASEHDVALASMDDPEMFGETFYFKGFGWAVENNLLTDYKVVVLAVDEGKVSQNAQQSLARGSELKLDDATKIIGCYKALAKHGMYEDPNLPNIDASPMRRALAFCQSIKLSKILEEEFSNIVEEYLENEELEDLEDSSTDLSVNIQHVDGTFNAKQREHCLSWLKDDVEENNCRILTNARCLSEGVDVPSLDAIMFLHPRKSQIDVVQSVGRVMRKDPDGVKKMGYVILPIAIPPNIPADVALNDNERYKVVWQILNALRTHDERLDSTINRIKLGEDVSDKIQIVGVGNEEMDSVTATVPDIKVSKSKPKIKSGKDEENGFFGDSESEDDPGKTDEQMTFVLDDLSQAIKAKIVEKCGTREYWEKWAGDIAKIAQTHVTRITTIVDQEGSQEKAHFEAFLEEIRDDLNPEISKGDAVEMLAQHLITKPVFDTLFSENQFTKENPVSKAMETVLGQLHQHNLGKESESLKGFYDVVKKQASGVVTAKGRQELIKQLYENFFKGAFKKLTDKLGIVYTPPEVIDFIIHSVNDVLQEEFGQTLGSEGVHIIDPFTGTGTFITRLLQSGLITKEQLEHKYKYEIHANEIVLLAYYIAAVNIESVYQDLSSSEEYESFNGIVLTDTFQLYEQERDMIANLLPDNSDRRTAQKKRDIDVVIGNPPYSVGQKSADDNASNVAYENLDKSISNSYIVTRRPTTGVLRDSYIRAFKWATDRIKDKGVIGFVSNAGWLDGNATDGMRKSLVEEFSKIYIFHLRGNARTSGEQRRKEKDNVFGMGTRTPVSINILVRNPKSTDNGKIFFHDIGDYLDRKEKLSIIEKFKSISGISSKNTWKVLNPDDNYDWLNQGNKDFAKYISLGNKKDKSSTHLFPIFSLGIKSNRDSWVYNFSFKKVFKNMTSMINTYNHEVQNLVNNPNHQKIIDPFKISWDLFLERDFKNKKAGVFDSQKLVKGIYRPFCKQAYYYCNQFNNSLYLNPKIFPNAESKNLVICVTGVGAGVNFSSILSDIPPNLHLLDTGQVFPLKTYEKNEFEGGLFENLDSSEEFTERDGISDEGFAHFQTAYLGKQFTKEDLFYYIYGILHSAEYKERFQNNLSKELPRIPAVPEFEDFMAFSQAGRKLGDLHVNYETVEPFNVDFKEGDFRLLMADKTPEQFYRVTKMKFGGKRGSEDKTTVIYNGNITMQNIPMAAYDYIVNGRPALEWVMERQVVKTDKKSGITNDANDYANETMNDPAYPLKLFQRVITVSLETMKIVNNLPALGI